MLKNIQQIFQRVLVFLHLSPLSLAEKCRITFGAAVVLILAIALILPYFWMQQLTMQVSLEAGRAKANILMRRHFQIKKALETDLAALSNAGAVRDANDIEMHWIRFTTEQQKGLEALTEVQKEMVESLSCGWHRMGIGNRSTRPQPIRPRDRP